MAAASLSEISRSSNGPHAFVFVGLIILDTGKGWSVLKSKARAVPFGVDGVEREELVVVFVVKPGAFER